MLTRHFSPNLKYWGMIFVRVSAVDAQGTVPVDTLFLRSEFVDVPASFDAYMNEISVNLFKRRRNRD